MYIGFAGQLKTHIHRYKSLWLSYCIYYDDYDVFRWILLPTGVYYTFISLAL